MISRLTQGEIIAIDGKTVRGSYDSSQTKGQSTWSVLGQVTVPQNMSLLRQIDLNLLGQDKSTKVGIAAKRKKAGWDDAYLIKILSQSFSCACPGSQQHVQHVLNSGEIRDKNMPRLVEKK